MSQPGRPFPDVLKHYRLERELGRGGMGLVIAGVDRRDETRVAVKILYPHLAAADESYRDRFEREAHIAALLRSPYTVHLLDFGVEAGTYFFVMEYIDGRTLAADLRHGALDPAYALRLASETARALEEAGARGIVHRDIKPENILIDGENRVKVADFGIARQTTAPGVTAVGGFVGTPAYSAPEQVMGKADMRTDVYQLGATLYHMLAGQAPFHGSTTGELLRKHQEASLPMGPIAHLPDPVLNLVRRCLEKDPLDRYQSASELAGAIDRARALVGRSSDPGQGYSPPRGIPPVVIAPPAAAAAALGTHDLVAPTAPGTPRGSGTEPAPTMDAATVIERSGTGTEAAERTAADDDEERRRKAIGVIPLGGLAAGGAAVDRAGSGADPLAAARGPGSYQAPAGPGQGGPLSYAAPAPPAPPAPPPVYPDTVVQGGPSGGGGGGAPVSEPGGAPGPGPGGAPSEGGGVFKNKGCLAVIIGGILAGLLGGLGFVFFAVLGDDSNAADGEASPTATASATASPSASPSASPTATATPSPKPSPSPSPSPSASPTATATDTATPTRTATPTPTKPPTATPTPTTPPEKVAPTQLQPLSGDEVVVQFTITWRKIEGVTYDLEVYANQGGCPGSGGPVTGFKGNDSPAFTVSTFTFDGGCWRVRANYDDGPGPWSGFQSFRVKQAQNEPTPTPTPASAN